jgi:ketosteroid isomerase-like protein
MAKCSTSRNQSGIAPRFCGALCCVLFFLFAACNQRPVDLQAEETAIRNLEAAWSQTAGAKQLEDGLSYYADGAASFYPNVPVATNMEAIRKNWATMLALPSLSLGWKVSKVDVASSGDLAWAYGTSEISYNDPKGNPIKDRGKWVDVLRKQPDGKWKIVADIFNSDLPLPSPSAN